MPVSACIHPDTKTGLAATLWRAICSQSSGKSPLHTIPGEHATESGPARDLRIRIYVETGTSRYTSVDRKKKERLDASKTEIPRRSGRSGLEPNIHWAFTVAVHCREALHPETQERTARQAPIWRVGPIPVGSERQKTRSPLPSAPIGAHTGKGRGK